MKVVEYILFAISIISWVGLLPYLIAFMTLPPSEEFGVGFCVILLIMIISSGAVFYK